jgi:phage gp36-like protein
MPYCTKEDIYDAMGETAAKEYATDVSTEEETVIEARIDAMIVKASARIDGYIANRKTVPLDPVPPMIADLCVDMAIYYIVTRKGLAEDSSEKAILEKYKDAVGVLRDIAAGKANIGTTSEDTGETAPSSPAKWKGKDSPFNLEGF